MLVKAVTCLIVGYIFSLVGYKKIMIPLLILQIGFISTIAFSNKESHFYSHLFNGAFYFYIIVREANFIVTVSAVPKTFGIKYGSSVLCLAECALFIPLLISILIQDSETVKYIICIVLNIVALIICFFFPINEMLDIGPMVDRDLIIFKNFGLVDETTNTYIAK